MLRAERPTITLTRLDDTNKCFKQAIQSTDWSGSLEWALLYGHVHSKLGTAFPKSLGI